MVRSGRANISLGTRAADGHDDRATARLVREAQRGDPASLDALCARHRPAVYAFLLSKLGNHEDAEDATQQAFERVRRYLGSYERRPGTPWRAWLFTLVRNLAADAMAVRSRADAAVPMDPFELNLRRELLGARPASHGAEWSDERLPAAMSALSEDQRRVLALRLWLDLGVTETAERLGVRSSYVGVLYARALARLRSELGGAEREQPRGDRSPRRLRRGSSRPERFPSR